MPKTEQQAIEAALLGHERDVANLTKALRDLRDPARDPEAVFVSAQILRHRIDMALLASRLPIPANQ